MTEAFPVLIETHGKQAFIFATGKRREAVGASFLVHAVTDWARESMGPTGTIVEGAEVEIVVATSGTVLAFVTSRERGVAIVAATTGRALREAPGLGVTGVVGDPFVWDSGGAPAAVSATFRTLAEVRSRLPGAAARFPVLPITELCPSSGLPVAGVTTVGGDRVPRSATSLGKLAGVEPALDRLVEVSSLDRHALRTATEQLAGDESNSPERVAVVHADGNGLGGLVSRLAELLGVGGSDRPDTDYADGYRTFSEGLDAAAQQAFRKAVTEVTEAAGRAPVVLPLVIGGDDLTFLADAADAPAVSACFLRRFVELAADDPAVAGPVRTASQVDDPRLGMAAGLVVSTPHFPFSAAYGLAEELLTEVAKLAKTAVVDPDDRPVPCVSLACHVQADTTGTTNEHRVKALVTGTPPRLLSAAPYVAVIPVKNVDRHLSDASQEWLQHRDLVADLFTPARRFTDEEDGRRVLASAQVHEVRRRLRPDPSAADEYVRRLAVGASAWSFLLEDGDRSLFTPRADGQATTRFLDALALSPFAGPEIAGVTA